MADEQQTPDTIVLIQGPWIRTHSWEKWIDRYSRRGYRVIASATSHLGTAEIVDHYDAIMRGLDRPPIVMGHAFGGAIAEILLDRGLGAAGVAIDAVPVRGRNPLYYVISAQPLSRSAEAWERKAVARQKQGDIGLPNIGATSTTDLGRGGLPLMATVQEVVQIVLTERLLKEQ